MSEQYISISLPSKGLAYKNVEKDKICIRPFTGKEEMLMAELNVNNVNQKLTAVLKNVLQGIDPKKLTTGDAKYIMLWEAINSYTSDFLLDVTCEQCLQSSPIKFDLTKINSVELPDEYKEPQNIELSNRVVNVRLITLEDEISAVDWVKHNKSIYLYNYAKSIVDDKLTMLDKLQMLEDMSTKDLKLIKDFHKKYEHGPDMLANYTCPLCGNEGKLVLPFRYDILFSFDR